MPWLADVMTRLPLAQAKQAQPGGYAALLMNMFPFIMIAVLFYVLMIRPERRKKAELLEMLQNLKRNDRVVTIGGIYGTVVATSKDAEEVTIKVDENTNTKLRVQRTAIARVVVPSAEGASKG